MYARTYEIIVNALALGKWMREKDSRFENKSKLASRLSFLENLRNNVCYDILWIEIKVF